MRAFIPNSAPWITDREVDAVAALLRAGRLGCTEANTHAARNMLRQFTAGHDVLLTTSCTTAMELALFAFDLQPTDRVVVPSFTFVSTANAILQAGGTPIFIDIEEQTLNLDLTQLEAVCGQPHVRGIMPVHYAGISCDMDRLMEIAKRRGLFVVEDAAHAVGALYRNKPLGTFGDFGAFSFHDTKNYVSGEGGALVLNNMALKEKVEWMYEKGTNRSQFLRGEIDKYTWVSRGSSYPMSAILAELLRVQLDRFEEICLARGAVVERYRAGLRRLVDEGHIRFTDVPAYATSNHHIAFFLTRDPAVRDPLLACLKEKGIGALFHYLPLHLSPYALSHLGTKPGQCPVTEQVAASIVRLPLFPHLPPQDCDYVIEQVIRFFHPDHAASPSSSVAYGTSAIKSADSSLDFSLIVPCYNEAPHLHQSLDEMIHLLDGLQMKCEVILIDDRSTDATVDRIKEYLIKHPHHRLKAIFHSVNQGRGATVTEGIREAHGKFVGFIDIDLEIHARYIPSALYVLQTGCADMVLAQRNYKFHILAWQRYLMSKGYRLLTEYLLQTPSLDTEAGFKFFRKDAILPILNQVQDHRWFWDTEVTVRAFDAGLRIHQEPVLFDRKQNKISTVKAFSDSVRSFKALLDFRRRRARSIL